MKLHVKITRGERSENLISRCARSSMLDLALDIIYRFSIFDTFDTLRVREIRERLDMGFIARTVKTRIRIKAKIHERVPAILIKRSPGLRNSPYRKVSSFPFFDRDRIHRGEPTAVSRFELQISAIDGHCPARARAHSCPHARCFDESKRLLDRPLPTFHTHRARTHVMCVQSQFLESVRQALSQGIAYDSSRASFLITRRITRD